MTGEADSVGSPAATTVASGRIQVLDVAVSADFFTEISRALGERHRLTRIPLGVSDSEIVEILGRADVLVSPVFRAAWRIPDVGDHIRLSLVHSTGAGTDEIDFASLPRGCTVCNVYGHEQGVAEEAVMLMIALQRDLLNLDASLRKGDWRNDVPYLSQVRGRTLLLLGFGHIGKEIARWGFFLGMRTIALTRSLTSEKQEYGKTVLGVETLGRLDELARYLPEADFVVVAVPASSGTIDLIGEPELSVMKRTAYIVNVGRARVVNEAALYNALKTRRIAGAGLGVWYRYPESSLDKCIPGNFPFQELDNVIMTPHKPTAETMAYRWRKIAENIDHLARGEPLENVVTTA